MIRKVAHLGKQSCSDQIVAVLNDMVSRRNPSDQEYRIHSISNGSLLLLAGMDDLRRLSLSRTLNLFGAKRQVN